MFDVIRMATVALALAPGCWAQAPKPNIVFFMADDTGWFNVGWHNPDSE